MRPDPRRPAFHVTPMVGWLNDPYGLTWHDGRYLLFFQYRPEAPEWAAGMFWGVVESTDLVRWGPPRVALRPATGTEGCWSGAVVVDDDVPVLLYTRVDVTRPDLGCVVLAHPDGGEWVGEGAPVLPGPPVTHFRDPYLSRTADGWRMVVGAGLDPPAGAVLGYSSPDLRQWSYDGVLCSRAADARGAWTGSVWECPQLFELDGAWVLVVSVAHGGVTEHVAYSVGSLDGSRFVPGPWRRLLHGDAAYAATIFLDVAGRRCALSWLREPAPATGRWSGALSLPMLLARDGDRVRVSSHPDVATLRGAPTDRLGPRCELLLHAESPRGRRLEVALGALTLRAERDTGLLWLTRPGQADRQLPLGDGLDVRVVLDASVAEVFTPAGAAALRIDPVQDQPLPTPVGVDVSCHLLTD